MATNVPGTTEKSQVVVAQCIDVGNHAVLSRIEVCHIRGQLVASVNKPGVILSDDPNTCGGHIIKLSATEE